MLYWRIFYWDCSNALDACVSSYIVFWISSLIYVTYSSSFSFCCCLSSSISLYKVLIVSSFEATTSSCSFLSASNLSSVSWHLLFKFVSSVDQLCFATSNASRVSWSYSLRSISSFVQVACALLKASMVSSSCCSNSSRSSGLLTIPKSTPCLGTSFYLLSSSYFSWRTSYFCLSSFLGDCVLDPCGLYGLIASLKASAFLLLSAATVAGLFPPWLGGASGSFSWEGECDFELVCFSMIPFNVLRVSFAISWVSLTSSSISFCLFNARASD